MPKKKPEDEKKTTRQTVKLGDIKFDEKLTDIAVAYTKIAQSDAIAAVPAMPAPSAMELARSAAGPFGGGVESERDGRPLFEGDKYTICAKCRGLKRVTDCVWPDVRLPEDEERRWIRQGMRLSDIQAGTCKSCLGLDRDVEGTITRAIDLDGDTTVKTGEIVMVGDVPIGVAMTGGKAGDTITVQLSGPGRVTIEEQDRRVMKTPPIGEEDYVFEYDESETVDVTKFGGNVTVVRRPMMINTGARESRYERRPRRDRPPFPGKKTESSNDITKARSRQIVLDEE